MTAGPASVGFGGTTTPPMIRLVYSNRAEELVAELARRVRAQQVQDGPLAAVRLVVPSANVENYARLGIARHARIAANLETSFLTGFAGDLLARSMGVRVANASALEAMALTLLLDEERLALPAFGPVRDYLFACGTADDPVDLRRAQLAGHIGRLFEQYSYTRGDMLVAWSRALFLADQEAHAEPWQRAMWLAMFGEGGLAAERSKDVPLVPMHVAVSSPSLHFDAVEGAVHVFAFSHFAPVFHQLFERLGRVTDVSIYSLSPCEGFWEDLNAADPAPLHLWGRPGRDQVRALNAIARFDHEDRFVDPRTGERASDATRLRQLQSDVLHRELRASPALPDDVKRGALQGDRTLASGPGLGASNSGLADTPDESLVLFEHASLRRELESVATEIWRCLEQDATLRFDDIAVLVPDADRTAYAAQLTTVFRETYDLPHRWVGVRDGNASPIGEAVSLLLALPLGRFTRQELLRVICHPAIVGEYDKGALDRWVAWSDALGIAHGADHDDHNGTYITRDTLNWDQGLRRLALGSLMAGDASGEPSPFELGGEAYIPLEVAPSELSTAAGFGRLVRSLLADAAFARQSELSPAEWGAFFVAMVEAYVAPSSAAEEEELAGVLRSIHSLEAMDLGGRRVRYRIAHEMARTRLPQAASSRGSDGVVVSTLTSLGPQPFRVVFACGMGEGRFPSPEPDDPLDLRWVRRQEGDLTPRERDRYAFLELLVGTRDRLILSYVSRDPITGDGLAPSSVIEELLHELAERYGHGPEGIRRRHALRRWDPMYFPDLFPRSKGGLSLGTILLPEARAEAVALRLRLDARAKGVSLSPAEVLQRAESDTAWAALADHLRLVRLGRVKLARTESRIQLPIYALVKFLEFPLQGWARFRLGLDELEDVDAAACEDEPFETNFREETLILRGVLLDACATGRNLATCYDDAVRQRELRGKGPSGAFARGERGAHLETLAVWCRELEEQGVGLNSIEVHRFGRGGEHSRADRVHDPLTIDVDWIDSAGVQRVVRAELGGRALPLAVDGMVSLTLAKRAEQDDEWARAGRQRAALRAFVDHAVLAASGALPPGPHGSLSVIATQGDPMTDRVGFAPLSPSEAVVWLRDVTRDLLTTPHSYFLPCEAVFARHRRDPTSAIVPYIEEARDKLADSDGAPALRSAYGPVPRLHEYPSLSEEDAEAVIVRRFGPMLGKITGST